MNDNEVLVSILCNTYNHEKYVRDALEGFVNQKTNFAYEILVHDDASTDSTADIIREYEAKYPDLIKPIYQTVNQYSQQMPITATYQLPRVQGKYMAFCEGDDFWTDDRKLQKQVDALEAHPEIDICAHQAHTMRAGVIAGVIAPSQMDCVFAPEQVISGGGGFVATASLMYRSTMIETYNHVMPLDYTWQVYGSLRGGMLYLSDSMSVYRLAVSGSWTKRMQADGEKRRKHVQCVENMLLKLDEDTQGRYTSVIQSKIINNRVSSLLQDGDYKKALVKENRAGFKKLPLKDRVAVRVYALFPRLAKR